MAQSVYFFYTKLKLEKKFIASIPSGNFGHAYAGWTAKKMGLSFKGINVATNMNDVLYQLFSKDIYEKKEAKSSLAPSMDISVASNFERLLFEIYEGDGQLLRSLFSSFPMKPIEFNNQTNEIWKDVKTFFQSSTCNDKDIIKTISQSFVDENILFDPHTATAFGAVNKNNAISNVIALGTAHPYKFFETVKKATGKNIISPKQLEKFVDKVEKFDILENNISEVKKYILSKI